MSLLLRELTEAYTVIEMLLAQQSKGIKKDRHKLKHDNLTVPTQLVPAGALSCHLQWFCHWGISLLRKTRSSQSKRKESSSHSTVPFADVNFAVKRALLLHITQAHYPNVCNRHKAFSLVSLCQSGRDRVAMLTGQKGWGDCNYRAGGMGWLCASCTVQTWLSPMVSYRVHFLVRALTSELHKANLVPL